MTASADVAAAAHEELATAGPGEPAAAQAALVIVGRQPDAREVLRRELSKRYGADYQIVVCDRPAELTPWMRDLRAAGLPVVVLRFAPRRPALVNPSNLEIVDAFGVMTPISPEEVFDGVVVGAGPAGLAHEVGTCVG